MGIIQRQGIKHSIVSLAGLAIGTLSTVFIYTQEEVVEAYGLIQFLLSIGIIGFPLFALSSNTVAIRFFPAFQNKTKEHHGFLLLLLLSCLAGWGLCAGIAGFSWNSILNKLAGDSALLRQHLWVVFPLSLFFTLALFLTQYAFNFKRIVIPFILLDFSLKIALPTLIAAIWLEWIDLSAALWWLLAYYLAVVVGLAVYLRQLGEWFWRPPDWGFLDAERRRDIAQYAGFGIATGFAMLLATKVDTFIVGSLMSMKSVGIYAIALNIAAALEIPGKSLYNASISFVAKYLAEENWTEMRSLYQKVSINVLTAGLLLFGCIWVSTDDLFRFMPNGREIAQGKYALLFLSVAKLVDMAAGLNSYLVVYSKYYRYSMLSLGILAAANIGMSLWLVPLAGLTGAAIAALVSISCYNLFNLALVWKKFHMQPFSANALRVILLALVAITAVWFLPSTGYPLLNILLRSGLFALLFAVLVFRFRVSEDIDALFRRMGKRV